MSGQSQVNYYPNFVTQNTKALIKWFRTDRGDKVTSWSTICGSFPIARGILDIVHTLVDSGELRKVKAGYILNVPNCPHRATWFEDWPDGHGIEVCVKCGKSRHLWGEHTTRWKFINLREARIAAEFKLFQEGHKK